MMNHTIRTSSSSGYEELETHTSPNKEEKGIPVVLATITCPAGGVGYEADQINFEQSSQEEIEEGHPQRITSPEHEITIHVSDDCKSRCSVGKMLSLFVYKLGGMDGERCPKVRPVKEIMATAALSFASILTISSIDQYLISTYLEPQRGEIVFLSAFYGATGVILFDQFQSPVAQPRNVVGGYLVCSTMGVCMRYSSVWLGIHQWLAAAVSVTLSLVAMDLTRTVHPPAAACALVAVIGSTGVKEMGFWYVLTSTGTALLMLLYALVGNNLCPTRQYPLYWY